MVNSTLQLQAVLEHILSNYQEETYSINQLCDESGQSRFQVHRTIKATLGLSFSQLLLRIRILGSVRLLIEQNGNVSDIAYRVGFSSPSYFSKCYTTLFSEAPGKTLNSQEFPSPRNSQTRKLLSHPTVRQLLVKKGLILDTDFETLGNKIKKRSNWIVGIVTLSIVLMTVFFIMYYQELFGETIADRSIAVMPIETQKDDESFSFIQSMTLGIYSKMSKLKQIDLLINNQSVQQYRDTKLTTAEIATELGVRYLLIVNGEITGQGNQVYVELVDTKLSNSLWSAKYTGQL